MTCLSRAAVLGLVFAAFTGATVSPAYAQSKIADLALEDLMDMPITSAGRKFQRLAEVAGAVYVIGQDDIRRSGATSIPELLRLAPGVQVARIDASKWAISIRGLNERWSNKLLVLVDGRTVYTREFSGVHWDSVQLVAEDIDRIEIVRGPGASLWGANAVDGVINIITRHTNQTTGTIMRASTGSSGNRSVALRQGGVLGSATYRAHASVSRTGASFFDEHTRADDDWVGVNGGARADWQSETLKFTLSGAIQRTNASSYSAWATSPVVAPGGPAPAKYDTQLRGGHALFRVVNELSRDRSLEVQSFVDVVDRKDAAYGYSATTLDVDLNYRQALSARHDLVTGAGYRQVVDRFHNSFALSVYPEHDAVGVFGAFTQHELRLPNDRIRLTGGLKVEHDDLSGWSAQPTGRVLWMATDTQQLWGAVSRAVRTPSRGDVGLRVNMPAGPDPDTGLPIVVSTFGNPSYRAESLRSTEVGYRFDGGPIQLDVAAYVGQHRRLQTYEPMPPGLQILDGVPAIVTGYQFDNLLDLDVRGVELVARWVPASWIEVAPAFTTFDLSRRPTATHDPVALAFDGNAPRAQFSVYSGMTWTAVDVDLKVSRTGALSAYAVPAFTRVDVRAEWRLHRNGVLQLVGQNLSDARHLEFGGIQNLTAATYDARRVDVSVAWSFR